MKDKTLIQMTCVAAALFLTTALLTFGHTAATEMSQPYARGRLRVMEWNVENLFDTVHDVGKRDEEFLPGSPRRWTSHRYWKKLTDVAKVIATVAADGGGMVDLVGLCEVENDSVMAMLTRRSALRELGYEYIMTESEDERGIDVALLYQPMRFRLLEYEGVRVASREHGLRATRDLLYVKGLVFTETGLDTLHVIVAHLPSQAGGVEGDRNRALAAQRLWELVDSIAGSGAATESQHTGQRDENRGRRILVMGDFNAGAKDKVFRNTCLRITDDRVDAGTYCFRGYWQWIDHVLVSDGIETLGAAKVVRMPWLLEENKTYGGRMPRRTFRGPTYHGGVSDHLPIVVEMRMKRGEKEE